jgi:signal transduction histidine kinase/DNA-binding NarL/FixJ family response regulator
LWNKHKPENRFFNGDGYATFRLTLLLPKKIKQLIFKIPEMPTSYKLWVNQELISKNGVVASNAKYMVPWFSPNVIHYTIVDKKPLILTLQIANYFHKDGGMWQSIEIGTFQDYHHMKTFPMMLDIFSCGCLLIMAFHHFGLFIVRHQDRSPLFFGLCCLLIGLRSLMVGQRMSYLFLPQLSWAFHQKFEFILLYLSLPSFCTFVSGLFPQYISKSFIKLTWWISLIFVVSVLISPVKIFSQATIVFQIFIIISSLYIFWAVVKAYQDRQTGSLVFIVGFLIILCAIINDTLTAHMIIQSSYLIHYAIIMFVIFQAFSLSKKYAEAYATIEEMSTTLTEKNKALVRMDQLKDEFLANTSHELKTPLHGIIGISTSLTDGVAGELSPSQSHYLSMISLCGKRLLYLINDLLDFSRMKRNDLKLDFQPTDIKNIIDILSHLIQPMLKDRSVKLICHVPENLQMVYADEFRVQQILFNLLGNAAKFTRQGEIIIDVTQDESFVIISVTDTGPGIPVEDQERIFNAFEQRTEEDVSGGTGLGLSISQRLAKLHGSEISLKSRPGYGSSFSFQLPVVSSEDTIQPKSNDVLRRYEPVISVQSQDLLFREDMLISFDNTTNVLFQGASVLAVDDDPINRQLIYDYLIVESFSVRLAVDGQDALECIEDELPDIILLDIMMPGMNGFDCCKTIRKKYDALSLPIIMLSAKSQTNDIVKGLNQGANDYLVKPFHKSELIARIQNNLQAKQSVENMKEARLLRKEILYRKEVENKLDIANRRLTRMLDCSDDAFLMIDHKGDVLFFNQSAEKFFGFQINELTKKNVKSLFDQSFMDSFQKSVNLSSDSESHIVISDASVNCYQEVLKRTIFLSGFMIPPNHYFSLIIKEFVQDSEPSLQLKNRPLEEVIKNISEVYGKEALKQIMDLRNMNPTLDAASDTIPEKDQFRMLIVETMTEAVQIWESITGLTKIDLADQSKLWKSYLDGSTWKTRTLDKYLNIKALPKKPRWRQVVRTVHFILKQCQLSDEKQDILKQYIDKIEEVVRLNGVGPSQPIKRY